MSTELFAENCLPAERNLLGALLFMPEQFADIQLTADDFFFIDHGWIWQAMQTIHARGDIPERALVEAELRLTQHLQHLGQSVFEDIGGHDGSPFYGAAYLTDLIASHDSRIPVSAYGKVLAALSARRRLLAHHEAGVSRTFEQGRSIYDVLAEDESEFQHIKQTIFRQRSGGLQPASVAITDSILDTDENYQAFMDWTPFRMGIPTLDKLLTPQPTELILFGARTGVGKSTMLDNIVYYNLIAPFIVHEQTNSDDLFLPLPGGRFIRYPKPDEVIVLPRIAYFSLEMGVSQVVGRWLAKITGISVQRQNNRRVNREEFSALQDSKALIKEWLGGRLLMMCESMTVESMEAECKAYQPDVVITDYIQLFQSSRKYTSDHERLGIVSKTHKALAMDLGIPVFSAAQINREGDKGPDKGPRLSELKGSGSLEEDSDTVVLMHRPDASDAKKRPGETDFNVAKHRNGDTGIVTLGYLKQRSLFVSVADDVAYKDD